jgi:hypothetical protein
VFSSYQTKERESFERELKELVKVYKTDDKFFTQIERLGGKEAHIMALDLLKEQALTKRLLQQKDIHRGFER